ncbi:MAG: phytanoyl-CoA dioxygenase family protein [Planctomycetales bacterium]
MRNDTTCPASGPCHGTETPAAAGGIRTAVFGDPGVTTSLRMCARELAEFRGLITDHWLGRIASQYPSEVVDQFRQVGLPRYHELAHLVDHKTLWPKTERLLPQSAVERIRSMPFMQALAGDFGEFGISNEEEIHSEEIYWRIVRPGAPSDIGPIHADAWFWELGHGRIPPDTVRVKVWIPFFSEPGMNGLLVLPGSQREYYPYHGEERDGFVKPQVDFDQRALPMQLLNIEPGTLVVFHDRLLHGGALNSGRTTRVSAEFTMFVSRAGLLARGCTAAQIAGSAALHPGSSRQRVA